MKISLYVLTALIFSGQIPAYAGKPSLDWEKICNDRERGRHYAECWRPPGDYQAVWQMEGEKRAYYLKKARKVVAQRLRTDQQQARWRRFN